MERTVNRLNLLPCQNILPCAGEEMWSRVRLLHNPSREEMTVAGPRWWPWRQRRTHPYPIYCTDRTSLADFMPLRLQKRKTQTCPSGSSWSSGQSGQRKCSREKPEHSSDTGVNSVQWLIGPPWRGSQRRHYVFTSSFSDGARKVLSSLVWLSSRFTQRGNSTILFSTEMFF